MGEPDRWPGWSTSVLALFVAALAPASTGPDAARKTVEQVADALDADVAAIVGDGRVIAAVGYPEGTAPIAELERVRPGRTDARLTVPGVGECAAVAVLLDHPAGATLVVARGGSTAFARPELGLLRAMARVAAMTMRLLCVLDDERTARAELAELARQQAALRRVATLVARGEQPSAVFGAVAKEVGLLVPTADVALVGRYVGGAELEFVGGWSPPGEPPFVGSRVPLGGRNVSAEVFERNAPARVDDLPDDLTPANVLARSWARSSAGAPIDVEGRLWGLVIVGTLQVDGLPDGIEHDLAAFTDLVATAVANAQAREDLSRLVAEQAALRRVAMIVARGEPSSVVFAAVAEEAGRVLDADVTLIGRYDPDEMISGLGVWSASGAAQLADSVRRGGHNVSSLVYETGRPSRIDDYAAASGAVAQDAQNRGMRSSVGAPIIVDGRVWGVMIAGATSAEAMPPGAENHLEVFTELVGTALANAQARDEINALAAEQAALRRVATLVARGVGADVLFSAVAEEITGLFGTEGASVVRFEPDGDATVMGTYGWLRPFERGVRFRPDERFPLAIVQRTGRAARSDVDDAALARVGPRDREFRTAEYRSFVAAPIVVAGQLWGAAIAGSSLDVLPPGAEQRMGAFTELVATAVANTEAWAKIVASRARIAATADETRRRIERDLHDGAQQQLVSLALQLRTAQNSVPPQVPELRLALERVVDGLTATLDELREYARGLHPAILAEGGLVPAVRTLARRSTVPVELELPTERTRLPEPVELTAYFVVSEALANAAKHAGATVVRIRLSIGPEAVLLSVTDDGVGGADSARGSGLLGLQDRLAAVGGRMTVRSTAGAGTVLAAELPIPAVNPAGDGQPRPA